MVAIDELHGQLAAFRSAPFLFVGSGLSRRYLQTDDWEGLLKRLAKLTGKPYGLYVTAANGQAPAIASAIAEDLHTLWWTTPEFAKSRTDYGDTLSTREGPLKVEVSNYVQGSLSNLDRGGSWKDELDALQNVVIDGIITTNYDLLLETIFPEFKTFVGQDELLFSDPQGIGEIYKIHGDAADPETVVLTDSDFTRFDKRNPYLAAKLLTIFVEHPIIFLGYSLSDSDVTAILTSIASVLTSSNLEKLEQNLILVEWNPDQKEPSLSRGLVTAEGFALPVQVLTLSSFIPLYEMLGTLEHKFSARTLRLLKKRVYELVLSNDPAGKLYVQDIDNADQDEVDAVFGVGMETKLSAQGYLGLSRVDLLHDVLEEHSSYNAQRLVAESIPDLLKQTGLTPIYRYLRESGLLDTAGQLIPNVEVHQKIRSRVSMGNAPFSTPTSVQPRALRIVEAADGSLSNLLSAQERSVVLFAAAALPLDRLDLEELRGFLLDAKDAFTGNASDRANWTRLVGMYDYQKFGLLLDSAEA
jgi:hypothetical protein